jgi:restriction endonuclease Mrr
MAVPEFQAFMLPVLQASSVAEVGYQDIIAHAVDALHLTPADLQEVIPSGRKTRVYDRV